MLDSANEKSLGASLLSIDRVSGIAIIECGRSPPMKLSVLPNEFVDGAPVARAIRETVTAMVDEPEKQTALGQILARRVPSIGDRMAPIANMSLSPDSRNELTNGMPNKMGCELQRVGPNDNAAWASECAVDAIQMLNHSYLCVQGPPGTGKTYTAAKSIAALIRRRRRVGVMAVSHRAITHLMKKSLECLADEWQDATSGVGPEVVQPVSAIRVGGTVADFTDLRSVCQDACAAMPNTHADQFTVRQIRGASVLAKQPIGENDILIGATAYAK